MPHDPAAADFDCRTCGACCAYSRDWPRFSLEDEAAIERIPAKLRDLGGMRCEGERCSALAGTVGAAVSCSIYAVRPDVCRECTPGDEACRMARAAFNLSPIGS